MKRRLVIERDLLARPDVAECDKENMVIEYFHVAVGFAGMVYIMSAVPTPAAVETPAIIDCADTKASSSGTAISFCIGYFFTGILRNFSALGKVRL